MADKKQIVIVSGVSQFMFYFARAKQPEIINQSLHFGYKEQGYLKTLFLKLNIKEVESSSKRELYIPVSLIIFFKEDEIGLIPYQIINFIILSFIEINRYFDSSESLIRKMLKDQLKNFVEVNKLHFKIIENIEKDKLKESINHPNHYGGDSTYEVIKVCEAWGLDKDAYLFNTIKYVARAGKKDKDKEIEDLEKALWYLQRKINNLKNK
mgnify:CR=1 FL=1